MLRPRTIKPLHRHAADAALRLADLCFTRQTTPTEYISFSSGTSTATFFCATRKISLFPITDISSARSEGSRSTSKVRITSGEHGKPAQGYHRQFFGSGVCFAHSFSFPEWVKISGRRELSLARCHFFTQSAVITTLLTVLSDGTVYITSVMTPSMTLRRPRAPIFISMALSATASSAPGQTPARRRRSPSVPCTALPWSFSARSGCGRGRPASGNPATLRQADDL